MKHFSKAGLLLVIASIVLSACGTGQMFGPNITPTPTQTFTPTNTYTPTATNTPVPTYTPLPTYTPTPIINLDKPISSYLSDVTITFADWFDTYNTANWQQGNGSFTARDGLLSVNGDGSGIVRSIGYYEGQGSLISFKLDKDSNFEFFFDNGMWMANSYERYGTAMGPRNGSEVSIWSGKNWIGQKIGNPKPGTWYELLLAIGKGPKFLLVVWERDSGTLLYKFSRQFPKWGNQRWNLSIFSHYGHVEFQNFVDIEFSGMKPGG